jgi:transposase
VTRLACYRGFDTQAGMVLATELGDWQRFGRATALMAYVGLVPKEDSSADRERKGAITKAGNSHCRHVLVQAAWSYRRRPQPPGRHLAARRAGQPARAIAHALKAEQRLYALFKRIAQRKGNKVAVVAVARELVGFLWAGMQDIAPIAGRAVRETIGVSRYDQEENARASL